MRRLLPLLPVLALLGVNAPAQTEPAGEEKAGPDSTIAPETFDGALLARLIFAETDRVRRAHGLKEFTASTEADAAAEIQARLGSMGGAPTHTNPFPNVATPIDRANWVGLRVALVGENVARMPLLDTGRNLEFEVRRSGDRRTYHDIDTGRELRPHTYASFAGDVVARWMASPGHRANILNGKYRVLGVGVHPTQGTTGADIVYSVQLFVTPEKNR